MHLQIILWILVIIVVWLLVRFFSCLWFWGEWIFCCIRVKFVIICRFATVYVVPPIAGKFFLIEQSAIGAQERRSLMTFTTVVTDMVSLTSGLHIGVHAWCVRYVFAIETRLWHRVVNWVVYSRCAWHFTQILVTFVLVVLIVSVGIAGIHLSLFQSSSVAAAAYRDYRYNGDYRFERHFDSAQCSKYTRT